MSIKEVNSKINHDITLAKRRAKREMTKQGFVNVDGGIYQYNPMMTNFIPVNNEDVIQYFNWIIGTSWGTLNPGNIIDYLKEQLPQITKNDLNDFANYIEQSAVTITEESIKELMENAIKENDVFSNSKFDFKGRLNLQSELTILRNNNIYSDGDWRLYKLTDGKFERIIPHDVYQLFRETIGTENTKLVLQYVKNHWRDYIDNLTNVNQLYNLLRQKELKETTMQRCKPGFENVLNLILSYGGK